MSFIKNILKSTPVKKLTQGIKSNVVVNGKDIVKKAGRQGKKNLQQRVDDIGKEIIKKSDGLVSSTDEFGELSNVLKGVDDLSSKELLGQLDEYQNLSKNLKNSEEAFSRVENGTFFDDIVKKNKELKKKELDIARKEAKTKGVDFDEAEKIKELDSKYKVENGWDDIREKRKGEVEAFSNKKNEALEKITKDYADDAEGLAKAKEEAAAKFLDEENAMKEVWKTQDAKTYEELGYLDGSRSDELAKAMGSKSEANFEIANQYLGTGATGEERAWRAGAIGAGVVGGGTALRLMGGGSFGYNANGERDIAGIPFI